MGSYVDKVNEPENDALFELVHDVMHRFKSVMFDAISGDESGIAWMEARALQFIASHPTATSGDLVRRSGRDKGQIARIVSTLVEQGLVEKMIGPDRRSHGLLATSAGKAVHRRIEKKRAKGAAEMFEPLSVSERKTLAELLQKIAR